MRTKLKITRPFLRQFFPENLVPQKKLSKKDKKFIIEKQKWIKKKRRDIQKVQSTLRKELLQLDMFTKDEQAYKRKKQKFRKKIRFLFSQSQIEKRLLRIENSNHRDSPFLTKLKEKKRLSLFYGGVDKKFFKKIYIQAENKGNIHAMNRGDIAKNVLLLFERRLDVVLYRIGFAKTITSARQYISHNLVFVNGNPITISTYQVQYGDCISLDTNLKEKIKKEIRQKINSIRPRQIFYRSNYKFESFFLENRKNFVRHNLVLLPYSIILQYVYNILFKGNINKVDNSFSFFQKANPLSLSQITKRLLEVKKRLNKLKKALLRKNKQLKKEYRYLASRLSLRKRQRIVRYKLKLNLKKWERKRIPIYRLKIIEKNLRKSFLIRLSLKRLDYIPNIIKGTYLRLNNLAGQNLLLERTRQDLLKLSVEKLMTRPLFTKEAKKLRLIKSFHAEICFQKLEATILYPTQKIIYPLVLNLELIARLSRLT